MEDAPQIARSLADIEDDLPDNLAHHRAELYQPTESPLRYSREDLLKYWPFVNNFWSEQKAFRVREGHGIVNGYCRCHADAARTRVPPDIVKRKREYNTQDCLATVKLVFHREGYVLIHLVKPHSDHGMDLMDKRHMSFGLKEFILDMNNAHNDDKVATHQYFQQQLLVDPRYATIGAHHAGLGRVRSSTYNNEKSVRRLPSVMTYLLDDKNWKDPLPESCFRHPVLQRERDNPTQRTKRTTRFQPAAPEDGSQSMMRFLSAQRAGDTAPMQPPATPLPWIRGPLSVVTPTSNTVRQARTPVVHSQSQFLALILRGRELTRLQAV